MPGDFINALARRIVSAGTHASVIQPAIADLQFEARTRSTWLMAQSYLGAWTAVCGGVLHDIGITIQHPGFIDEARTATVLVGMQAVYYGGMLSLTVAHLPRVHGAAILRLALLAVIASAVPVVALMLPKRDMTDTRAQQPQDDIG